MKVEVKICGIRDAETAAIAAEAGADWIGLVFFPASPRSVNIPDAARVALGMPAGIGRVGLFVQPADEDIAAVLGHVPLDALQVYAPPERLGAIRARFGLPVWRPVGVSAAADLPLDAGAADRLVIEAKPPAGAGRPGGNAIRFDWEVLAEWRAPAPWTLAGGLDPSSVASAIRQTGATAVDVSSGVERAPGIKDARLIRAFVAAARYGVGP